MMCAEGMGNRSARQASSHALAAPTADEQLKMGVYLTNQAQVEQHLTSSNVNMLLDHGRTLLMMASLNGAVGIVRLLMKNGANLNAVDSVRMLCDCPLFE